MLFRGFFLLLEDIFIGFFLYFDVILEKEGESFYERLRIYLESILY